jgi:hypothetical protein
VVENTHSPVDFDRKRVRIPHLPLILFEILIVGAAWKDTPMSKAKHERYSSHEARSRSEGVLIKERVSDHRGMTSPVGAGIKPCHPLLIFCSFFDNRP